MRILMLAPQPFLEPRGTPISVYQRARGLGELGHQVDLVTYHVGRHVDLRGVTIHRIPKVPFIKEVKVGPSWYKPLLDLLLLGKALSLLATRRYDVIHSHEEAAFFSMLLAPTFRTRHLYDMHSSLPKQLVNFNYGNTLPLIKLFEAFENRVINTADAVITIGSDLEEYVREQNPRVPHVMIQNQAVHGPDGMIDQVAVNRLKAQLGIGNRLPIVYTGTFERYQGIELLIGSAKILKQQCPEAVFVLVGGKPAQVEYWKNEARLAGVEDRVLFVGTVPIEEVNTYVDIADILVSPRTEGTSVPLKIYTYLHSGKPVVATNLTAHTIVLTDETAVLTDPTVEAFATGLMKLVRSPELRQQIGEQAQQYALEHHNAKGYMTKLEEIYAALRSPTGRFEMAA